MNRLQPMPIVLQEEVYPTPLYRKKFFGGIIDRIADTWDAFWNKEHVPKRFRNFLKAHGKDTIKTITMFRAPLDGVASGMLQAITLGDWDNIKKAGGHDKLYHVGLIINGKYTVEKLEKLEAREGTSVLNNKDAETYNITVNKDLTISDLFTKAAKHMGSAFAPYDAFKNNCQSFVKGVLEANGLLNAAARAWVYQDIKKLVEVTPSYTKELGSAITGLAGKAGNVWEALVHKRGGLMRHPSRPFKPF